MLPESCRRLPAGWHRCRRSKSTSASDPARSPLRVGASDRAWRPSALGRAPTLGPLLSTRHGRVCLALPRRRSGRGGGRSLYDLPVGKGVKSGVDQGETQESAMPRQRVFDFLSSPLATFLLITLSGVMRLLKSNGFSWIYMAAV